MINKFGNESGKLGFGLMRLPRLADNPEEFDKEQIKQMVDKFLDAGFTYFDTAFVYTGSEAVMKECLVDRHPRSTYTIATKLNAAMGGVTEEEAKKEFEISLERTGAGYFDYYLLHALGDGNYKKYEDYGIWEFVKQKKAEGKIRHMGFSFHGSPELLERLLTEHPEAEFVQLQINYADWEDESVQSRRNYEIARRFGKPIVVMEPVKGGTLANPIPAVKKIFDEADPGASYASWAIRFVASHEGILAVLSGMSTIEQVEDNTSYMKEFKPLTEEEEEVIRKAQEALRAVELIPCTACRYCTEGCPMEISIPDILAAQNKILALNDVRRGNRMYEEATKEHGKASDCIQCGQCESVCPQGLPIIELLKNAAVTFES
ncbi:MAG: aldo/keto reductase [Erysipelotrichales bacterium]|nr:aldo/keto reductase [Erysipelotrichales bacterium]